MDKIFSWIKNSDKHGVRKWRSSALNNNENGSANFDIFFEDKYAATSMPIINKKKQIDLNDQQLHKTIKTSNTLSNFTTQYSQKISKNQQTTANTFSLKNKKKKFDLLTTSEKNNFNNSQQTDDFIPINITPTPSPAGSFKKSLRYLKQRLTLKRKNGFISIENNFLTPQTIKQQVQTLNNQKEFNQLNINNNEPNNKVKVVFINQSSPEFQKQKNEIIRDYKINKIELTNNLENSSIYNETEKAKPKLDFHQTDFLDKSKTNKNKEQLLENDISIESKSQPSEKIVSKTIYLPLNSAETILSNVQTPLEQNANLENSNCFFNNEQNLLISNNSSVLNKQLATDYNILNEKFDKLNEKKFYVNSALLSQPKLVSTSALLNDNQNESLNNKTNSVIKTAYETEPTNIKSEVINKKTILKKLLTEDASLFDEIEKNVIPSTPETVCLERRRLRFHEPQISLSFIDTFERKNNLILNSSNNNIFESENDYDSSYPSTSCDLSSLVTPTLQKQSPTTNNEKRRASLAARRQSNVQLVHKVVGRRTSTTLLPLTAAQIHLVRVLWRQIFLTKGPTIIGESVMYKLGFKYPKLRQQLRTCPLLIYHSNRDNFIKHHSKSVGDLINLIVENLDNLQSVETDLKTIGRAHARIFNEQISSKIWNLAAETFIDCTLEWGDRRCRSETVRKAWALIIAFVIEKIKFGHLDERKQMLLVRSTVNSLKNCNINISSNTISDI